MYSYFCQISKFKEDLCNLDDEHFVLGLLQMTTLPLLTQKLKSQMTDSQNGNYDVLRNGWYWQDSPHQRVIEEQSPLHRFDHCVWITLGPKYQSEDILVDNLA